MQYIIHCDLLLYFQNFDILQKMYFIYLTLYKSRTTFLFSFIQYKKILRISKQEFLQCLPPLSYFFQFFGSVFLTFQFLLFCFLSRYSLQFGISIGNICSFSVNECMYATCQLNYIKIQIGYISDRLQLSSDGKDTNLI